MPRLSADVLDSKADDWTITDDGRDFGPTTSWPAPRIRPDDRTPAWPSDRKPTKSVGLPDAYAFLRHPTSALAPREGPNVPIDDAMMLVTPRRSGSGAPLADAGMLIRDVAQGPNISLRGIPSYRVVPEPTVSFEEDNPGVDRFEAGILRRFLARTDAGALDGFGDLTGQACHGILNGWVYDGPSDDAGMPQSWYDVIGRSEQKLIALLKQWSSGKLAQRDVDSIHKAFADLMAHATDGEKWSRFKRALAETRRVLDLVDSPAISATVRAPMAKDHAAHVAEFERMWKGLEAHVNNQGGILRGIGDAVSSVGGAVASVGKGAVSIAKGIATPVAALVTSPIKLASDIAKGKNVFESLRDTVKRDFTSVKEVAPYVQAVISFVPGVGAGVNAAIAAGAALAQGQPITSALVAGLKNALPGGPIAAQAFDTAYNVARGQNLSEAALQAVVNNLPGGDVAKQAAQTAIAVAKGQNLQQAALGLVKGAVLSGDIKVPGGELATKTALDLVGGKSLKDVALSAAEGQAMQYTKNHLSPFAVGPMNGAGPRMLSTLKSGGLPNLLPNDAKLVAGALLNTPALRSLPLAEVARRLNVPTHIARSGAAAVLQSVQRSGGSAVPMLAQATALEQKIPFTATFDQMMAKVASKAAPPAFSHNATTQRAAQLRQHANVFRQLQAHGLDAGALDPKLMPTIKQGSTGDAVVQWQKILGVTADGKFGPNTAAATKTFQQKHGLTADGIVGPNTWLAGLGAVISAPLQPGAPPVGAVTPPPAATPVLTQAMPTIRLGSTGAPVKTWQTFLGIPADGQFGPQTDAATRAFQAKNGLTADGIVGPNTWAKAMSGSSAPPIGTPTGAPPIVTLPPMTVPPLIPGMPPITLPPVTVSQPPVGSPPGTPPIITVSSPPMGPPLPPSVPPAPPSLPPITTSPPDAPPVVMPPATPPSSGGAKSAMLPVAIGLGLLVFVMSGSAKKLF